MFPYTNNCLKIDSKEHQNAAKKGPDESQALQKVAKRAHRQPKQAKHIYKDDTSTPKKRQKPQKGSKRNYKSFKNMEHVMENVRRQSSERLAFKN